ncbi:PHP domain-containing protein [Nakamurella antarctica]|uniref:PHP domain-containing protein n=1 Tax=Nakamurella antarctica TaxID=1902245 RepID=A0A3G8ZLB9_9ACTN|nr:PHP domain-containing protein [Nakamurella antarctica]AZI58122.1 PHP domain-containing protein [Nakamurella antarctica]
MRIDLHSHSSSSDGTETPAELMASAGRAGLDVIGITDHDTTSGWDAAEQALPTGMALMRGTEFSTEIAQPNGRPASIHLLGYLFDPSNPTIVQEHIRLRQERMDRGLRIVEKMVRDGIDISAEQVLEIASGAPVGRPHIGRALKQAGLVESVHEAFATYLRGDGPYYVHKADTDLETAIAMIAAAGGVSVIAHPRSREAAAVLGREKLRSLAAQGLDGIEVFHPDHDEAARTELAALAEELDLIPTGSSDFHGTNKTLRLGQDLTPEKSLQRIVSASSGVVPLLQK